MYTVEVGDQVLEFETRKEAVAAGKEASGDARGMVLVTDDKAREELVFKDGGLLSYNFETRSHKIAN